MVRFSLVLVLVGIECERIPGGYDGFGMMVMCKFLVYLCTCENCWNSGPKPEKELYFTKNTNNNHFSWTIPVFHVMMNSLVKIENHKNDNI